MNSDDIQQQAKLNLLRQQAAKANLKEVIKILLELHQNAERNKDRIGRRERALPQTPKERVDDALEEISKLKLLYDWEFKKTAIELGEDFARAEPRFTRAIEAVRDAAHAEGMHQWHDNGIEGFTGKYKLKMARKQRIRERLWRELEYVPGRHVLQQLLGHPHFFHALTRPR